MYPNQPVDASQPLGGEAPPASSFQNSNPTPQTAAYAQTQATAGSTFHPTGGQVPPSASPQFQLPPAPATPAYSASVDNSATSAPYPISDDYYQGNSTGKTLGVLSLVFSLIPLIGLILGIISVVKGLKSSNKILTLLGGIAIPLSVVMAVIGYTFVYPALAGVPRYSETTTYNGSYSDKYTNISYSFEYPKEMTIEYESEATGVLLIHRNEDNEAASLMKANAAYVPGAKALLTDTKEQKNYTDTVDKQLKEILKFTTVNSRQTVVEGDRLIYEFEGDIKQGDGSLRHMLGVIALTLNDDFFVTPMVVAPEQVWNRNQSLFNKVIRSGQVQGTELAPVYKPPAASSSASSDASYQELLDSLRAQGYEVQEYDLNSQFNIWPRGLFLGNWLKHQ